MKQQAGFTVAELLLASFLMLLGVLAATSLGYSILKSQRRAGDQEIAQQLARDVLEEHIYYAQSAECSWWSQTAPGLYGQEERWSDRTAYRVAVYLTDQVLPADPEAPGRGGLSMKRLEVVVYRPDRSPPSRLSRLVYAP